MESVISQDSVIRFSEELQKIQIELSVNKIEKLVQLIPTFSLLFLIMIKTALKKTSSHFGFCDF